MVAVIHSSSSLKNALQYNENKMRQGVAKLIHSGNYHKDTELLGFNDKLFRLEHLANLNKKVKTNSVHISLNFDPSDKLDTEKLRGIADQYLEKIGFGEQPYLVYQHQDAGHPHIHIITTNIRASGERISLHNLGRNQSEKARKEIEQQYGLIRAENKVQPHYDLEPVNAQKIRYGKTETKRAITNVLDYVLPVYKYGALTELNAILKLYNVVADRGSESSRIYQNQGLVYRVLDSNGEKVGVPVKASSIYSKPTLKNIEARFEKNEAERQQYKKGVKTLIDFAFMKKDGHSLQQFMQALQKEKIHVVLRQNKNEIIYGITYIDHHTKCVFNGSHLGTQYSANAIQQRCNPRVENSPSTSQQTDLLEQHKSTDEKRNSQTNNGAFNLIDDLLQPETNRFINEPFEQKQFKRKRKRKHQQIRG